MELLYVLVAAICLILVWRGISLFMEWRTKLRLKIEPVPPGPDLEVPTNPEVGPVRVVRRTEPVLASEMSRKLEDIAVTGNIQKHQVAEAVSAELSATADASLVQVVSSGDGLVDQADEPVLLTPASVEVAVRGAEQQDLFADEPIAPPPDRRHAASRAQALYGAPDSIEPVRPVAPEPVDKMPMEIEQVIALHVVSREHPFNGEDLLRAVLSYGLRFGDMSIFHRHEQPSGQGKVLFSMAKAVEPGIFDLEAMTGEEVPGVSFFLALPGVNSIIAYDIMVDTARRLANELQGDVLDENQQPLTRQLIEHYRERVQEFERHRLMPRAGGR